MKDKKLLIGLVEKEELICLANKQLKLEELSTIKVETPVEHPDIDFTSPIPNCEKETVIVYSFLQRDYTANAMKTDKFFGDDTKFYAPKSQIGTIVSWNDKTNHNKNLLIRANGYLIEAINGCKFECPLEHSITYKQPSTLECPETVKMVIRELHETNSLELTDRQKTILRPFKRYPA